MTSVCLPRVCLHPRTLAQTSSNLAIRNGSRPTFRPLLEPIQATGTIPPASDSSIVYVFFANLFREPVPPRYHCVSARPTLPRQVEILQGFAKWANLGFKTSQNKICCQFEENPVISNKEESFPLRSAKCVLVLQHKIKKLA